MEREAINRLNELDRLIEDARKRKAKGEPPMQKYQPPPGKPAILETKPLADD